MSEQFFLLFSYETHKSLNRKLQLQIDITLVREPAVYQIDVNFPWQCHLYLFPLFDENVHKQQTL